jgi:uncharacterized protein (TIGR02246 family)
VARELYGRLIDAWNRRDAAGYATVFSPDAVLIGFDGSLIPGDGVEAHLTPIFADHPTARYVTEVSEVRAIGADGLILLARVGMVPPGADDVNPAVNAHQSLVARRDGDEWRVVLFQNTPAQYHGRPDLAEAHTEAMRARMST